MSKVSIIVPIYNVEDYLGKCLDSLTNQTYKDIEIICVDDGSKDNSLQVAKEYEKEDKRIKVYTKENGGLSDARNYGIKYATGDYLLFIDSDDYIELSTVEKCINKVNETGADIVVFDLMYVSDNGSQVSSGGNFDVTSINEWKDLIYINNSACNKLIKKELMNDVSFPKGLNFEDLATIPILLTKANKVAKINEALYYYVQRGNSIAHSINDKIFDVYKAIKIIDDYFKAHDISFNVIDLYIKHGLYLTVLRIKDNSNDIEEYLKKNNEYLDKYYPGWRKVVYFTNYSYKSNIIFKCLQLNKYKLVRKIFKK